MRSIQYIALFLLVVSVSCADITIDFHYETLCPYCKEFLLNSFRKFYVTLLNYPELVQINLYPYGNAKYRPTDEGGFEFTCQHGPRECQGNIYQVCALNRLSKREAFDFVICFEEKYQKNELEPEATCLGTKYQQVKQCAESIEGQKLQYDVAQISDNLTPPHKYVPWLVVNGLYDRYEEIAIRSDLKGFICARLGDKIKECNDTTTTNDITNSPYTFGGSYTNQAFLQ